MFDYVRTIETNVSGVILLCPGTAVSTFYLHHLGSMHLPEESIADKDVLQFINTLHSAIEIGCDSQRIALKLDVPDSGSEM